MGFGNVYYGLAKRALDQSIASVKSKGSLALTRSMAYHPEIQHAIAEMVIELESIGPHLDAVAEDWSNGVDHGANGRQKSLPPNTARSRAPGALWISGWRRAGGQGIFRSGAGYERLVRDARLGQIHPANSLSDS